MEHLISDAADLIQEYCGKNERCTNCRLKSLCNACSSKMTLGQKLQEAAEEKEGNELKCRAMETEYISRIAAFIEEYIDIKDDKYNYADDIVIRCSIKKLLKEGVFTREELKREALHSFGVFISDELIDRSIKSRFIGD